MEEKMDQKHFMETYTTLKKTESNTLPTNKQAELTGHVQQTHNFENNVPTFQHQHMLANCGQ